MAYQVNEIFTSIQGEGVHTGQPATFIRLQGCPVGCPWCDTKYTWAKGGKKMTVEKILEEVKVKHVVITGGEPTLHDLDELLEALSVGAAPHWTQLETSGLHSLKGGLRPNFITWSPKRNLAFRAVEPLYHMIDEVKFVVDKELTLEDVWNALDPVFAAIPAKNWPFVTFMPEGCGPKKPAMDKAYEFTHAISELTTRPVRFSDRLQYRLKVR